MATSTPSWDQPHDAQCFGQPIDPPFSYVGSGYVGFWIVATEFYGKGIDNDYKIIDAPGQIEPEIPKDAVEDFRKMLN